MYVCMCLDFLVISVFPQFLPEVVQLEEQQTRPAIGELVCSLLGKDWERPSFVLDRYIWFRVRHSISICVDVLRTDRTYGHTVFRWQRVFTRISGVYVSSLRELVLEVVSRSKLSENLCEICVEKENCLWIVDFLNRLDIIQLRVFGPASDDVVEVE